MAFEAYELVNGKSAVVLTCEHASNRVPDWLPVSESDRGWLQTHWGWDIGAGDVCRSLAAQLDASAVLGGWSRLVCDLNRPVDDPTWIRAQVEGAALSFNAQLDDATIGRRVREIYDPFHQAIDNVLEPVCKAHGTGAVFLLAVHSFTPVYAGQERDMDIGVLFDERHQLAGEQLATRLQEVGFRAVCNEPYSGFEGLISTVQRHGRNHGVTYLELEIRQDLIGDSAGNADVADRLGGVFRAFWPASA